MKSHLERAVEAVLNGMSIRGAARKFGVPRSTLQDALRRRRPPVAEEDVLRRRIRELEREVARLKEAALDDMEARKILGVFADHQPSPPEWTVDVSNVAAKSPGVPVLVLSDWHIGEVVDPSVTGGRNRFDLEEAERRVRRLVERAVDLCFCHMVGAEHGYPGIVTPILGDMVSGEIHEELARTNGEDLLPSVLRTADLLVWVLERLRDHFGRVYAPACVGNHGRHDRKQPAKGHMHRNFDWLIYQLALRHFDGDDTVIVDCPADNTPVWEIYGVRFAAVHGHDIGVRGGDGIIGALGPIMRGRLKVGAQQSELGRDFDVLLMGHWHQYIPLPRVIVNNTLKGWDEYAAIRLRAPFSRPSQALFFVHPKHGVTCHWQVFVDSYEYRSATATLAIWN